MSLAQAAAKERAALDLLPPPVADFGGATRRGALRGRGEGLQAALLPAAQLLGWRFWDVTGSDKRRGAIYGSAEEAAAAARLDALAAAAGAVPADAEAAEVGRLMVDASALDLQLLARARTLAAERRRERTPRTRCAGGRDAG